MLAEAPIPFRGGGGVRHSGGMVQDWFGEDVAARYDAGSAERFDPAVLGPTVDFLAGLAGDGAVLELAIGTGRVALPLRERGVDVRGIDLSSAMVDRLRAKPGGAAIEVTIGDIATTQVAGAGHFRLVYLVFNTIGNLTTQDQQVECFRNAAAHLGPGGCFVVETGVPNLRHLPPGESIWVFARERGYLGFDEYTDLTTQQFTSHHWHVGDDADSHGGDGQPRVRSLPLRYVWPSELDLMARLAGMSLRERWSSWSREPFTGESGSHVSVWQKPE
jgi:SAM-dependent methyltransferase